MHLPERGPAQSLIGVSVDIPAPWSTMLTEARVAAGDPWALHIPPHITIIGPTVVDHQGLLDVFAHLDAVTTAIAPFDVHLHGTGTFRPVSPVVFVEVADGGDELQAIEHATRTGPLAQELRFPYRAHVTVAHEVSEEALDRTTADLAGFDAKFPVEALWLYEHGDDSVWRKRHRFDLRG
jgi:2'-5' RNA ligase